MCGHPGRGDPAPRILHEEIAEPPPRPDSPVNEHIGDLRPAPGRLGDQVFVERHVTSPTTPPAHPAGGHHAASRSATSGAGAGTGRANAGSAGSGNAISRYSVRRISRAACPGTELARARSRV